MDGNGNTISNQDIQTVLSKLADLEKEKLEKFQKNLKAIAYLTFLFRKAQMKPIIVGGHAVELYTLGNYTTMDVDLVLSGRDRAKDILESAGFTKEHPHDKYWYHEKLNIPVEIPDHVLDGSMDKVIEVEVEHGYFVYVIGIEDLILDRAKAAVYWNSSQDREWALFLMSSQWDEIDFDYLATKAQAEPDTFKKVYNLIMQLKSQIECFTNDQK